MKRVLHNFVCFWLVKSSGVKVPTQGEIAEVVYCEGLKILRRWFDSISLHKKEVFLLLDFRPRRKVEELGCGVIGNTRLFGGRIPESYSGIPTKPQ